MVSRNTEEFSACLVQGTKVYRASQLSKMDAPNTQNTDSTLGPLQVMISTNSQGMAPATAFSVLGMHCGPRDTQVTF